MSDIEPVRLIEDRLEAISRRLDGHISSCRLFQLILTIAAVLIAWRLQ